MLNLQINNKLLLDMWNIPMDIFCEYDNFNQLGHCRVISVYRKKSIFLNIDMYKKLIKVALKLLFIFIISC